MNCVVNGYTVTEWSVSQMVHKDQKAHLIPCDKDCYYQQQGYCTLDEITCITCFQDGCGYFTSTDPYADLSDDRYSL